jgi:hypothetical protein
MALQAVKSLQCLSGRDSCQSARTPQAERAGESLPSPLNASFAR